MLTSMTMPSPLGPLRLVARGEALVSVDLRDPRSADERAVEQPARVLAAAVVQLAEYFAGERRVFDLALGADGTMFQELVWRQLAQIPFGETWSYGELARAIGRPSASRAVGAANSKNPLAIIVPCHRVIGASGELTGYAGGMAAKRWLLDHERAPTLLDRAC